MRPFKIVTGLAVLAALAYFVFLGSIPAEKTAEPAGATGTALASVLVPETLSASAVVGQKAYENKCSVCHAQNGAGQLGVAPPLVHKIYEPSHHGDESFQRAAALGVKSHHWPFGDMPPVDGLTRGDLKMIIAYIRELQVHNGIN